VVTTKRATSCSAVFRYAAAAGAGKGAAHHAAPGAQTHQWQAWCRRRANKAHSLENPARPWLDHRVLVFVAEIGGQISRHLITATCGPDAFAKTFDTSRARRKIVLAGAGIPARFFAGRPESQDRTAAWDINRELKDQGARGIEHSMILTGRRARTGHSRWFRIGPAQFGSSSVFWLAAVSLRGDLWIGAGQVAGCNFGQITSISRIAKCQTPPSSLLERLRHHRGVPDGCRFFVAPHLYMRRSALIGAWTRGKGPAAASAARRDPRRGEAQP